MGKTYRDRTADEWRRHNERAVREGRVHLVRYMRGEGMPKRVIARELGITLREVAELGRPVG